MTQQEKTLLPTGFEDLIESRADHAHQMLVDIIETFKDFDYALVDPPLLEYEDSLLSAQNFLQAQDMFRLIDPVSHQTLGLRGDITVQVVRLARDHLSEAPRPIRLAYYGQVLRIKSTPLRPQRQYMQLGIEQIGGDEHAEIEVLQVALEALSGAGVSGICLDFVLPTLLKRYLPDVSDDIQNILDVRDIGNLRLAMENQQLDKNLGAILEFLLLLPPEPFLALQALEEHAEFAKDRMLFKQFRRIITQIQLSHPEVKLSLDVIEQQGFAYKTGVAYTLLARGQNTSLGRGGRYEASGESACGVSLNLYNLLSGSDSLIEQKKIYIPYNTDFETVRQLRSDGWKLIFHADPETAAQKNAHDQSLTTSVQQYFRDGQIHIV